MARLAVGTGSNGRRASRALAGALGGIGAVFVVLLMVGSATAAPVSSPPGTATPPYKGIPLETLTTSLVGCGKVSIPVPPVFNTTTGRSHQSVRISLTSCLGLNGTVAAESVAGLESLPIAKMSNGSHMLTEHWTLNYRAYLAATPGGTKERAFAEAEIEVQAVVFDATLDEDIGGTSQMYYVQHNITHGVYYHNVTNGAITTWTNVSLNSSHVYQLVAVIGGIELAEVGPGTSTAVVSLNLGPGGNGTRLDSVRFG